MTQRVESPQQRLKRIEREGKEFEKRMKKEANVSEAEAKREFEKLYAGRVRPGKPAVGPGPSKRRLIKPTGDRRPRG